MGWIECSCNAEVVADRTAQRRKLLGAPLVDVGGRRETGDGSEGYPQRVTLVELAGAVVAAEQ